MEMCRRSAALQIDWSTLALNETVSVRLVFVSKLKTCSMAMCSFQAFQFSRANLNLLLLLNTLQFQEDPYFHLYLYPLDPFGSLGWPYKAKNKATKCEVTRYAEPVQCCLPRPSIASGVTVQSTQGGTFS